METTTLLTELLKQGPLLAFMGIALYVFYKKDETRRANDLIERDSMRQKIEAQEIRIENYLKEDALVLQGLVKESITSTKIMSDTTDRQTKMMEKTNETMSCIIREIQEFKKSDLYLAHENRKS